MLKLFIQVTFRCIMAFHFSSKALIAAFTICICISPSNIANAAELPTETTEWWQWRGPNRDAQVGIKGPWPVDLKETSLIRKWRVDCGDGYPGPIVSKDKVFTSETANKTDEVVKAYDRLTGKLLWSTSWKGSMSVPFFAAKNGSWIRSTPTFDGESLYVAGMRDVLVCLDATSGKERWKVDFVEKFGTALPAFGFVCSPLVDDKAVYVQAAAAFVKLDKKTGEVLWRTLQDAGGMNGSAFSSPVRTKMGGKDQIVVQSRTHLAGIDPVIGKVLWKVAINSFRGMNILTPTIDGETVFTSAYGGKAQLIRIESASDGVASKEVWNADGAEANMSSPVIYQGHAYLHLRNRRVVCVNLATGKTTWTSPKPYGDYWSMVANGDKILALDNKGILYLMEANPKEFKIIDERKISEQETWGHLAVVGNELFIREQKGLSAWEWKSAK